MKPLADHVNSALRKLLSKKNPVLAEIIINWSKIVGVKFSKVSHPVKITSSRQKGERVNILHINVENSSLALEMSFQQDIILERIAVYLGYKALHKIKLGVL